MNVHIFCSRVLILIASMRKRILCRPPLGWPDVQATITVVCMWFSCCSNAVIRNFVLRLYVQLIASRCACRPSPPTLTPQGAAPPRGRAPGWGARSSVRSSWEFSLSRWVKTAVCLLCYFEEVVFCIIVHWSPFVFSTSSSNLFLQFLAKFSYPWQCLHLKGNCS